MCLKYSSDMPNSANTSALEYTLKKKSFDKFTVVFDSYQNLHSTYS
jgi:hypothetical protein